jgi:16S rRNA (guanine966-N2)-methyltransferase
VRIIAGEFGGRQLVLPSDRRVRPTTDRMREAWLGILDPRLDGASVVDLFAGSGALGLEALSRGAAHVDFVELSGGSLAALRRNIESLGVVDRVTVRRGDALRFARRLPGAAYDVALADPPYSTDQGARLIAIFKKCAFAAVLAVGHPTAQALEGDETRRYGTLALTFCYAS